MKKLKNKKGITLIALVVTIIILLILAGVTITTLMGENGIIIRGLEAREKTEIANTIEKVQVKVLGSYGTDGNIDMNALNNNLGNISGLTYEGIKLSDSNKIKSLPTMVTLNGSDIVIDANGSVIKKVTVVDSKTNKTVFEDNTTIIDNYGNFVTIPVGFKIASDSATDVTGGIVIEDSTYTNTMGSQFVWIPVGDIQYADGTKSIGLGRYYFLADGTPCPYVTNSSGLCSEDTVSSHNSSAGNAIAIDIEKFITSANNNHGYYLGRFEAGVLDYEFFDSTYEISAPETSYTGYAGENIKLVCKSDQQVWNYITQNKASELSKHMYTNNKFTSDLINSYAWDTAIVFIQEFSGDTDYAMQNSLCSSLNKTGQVTNSGDIDVRCNIYDMANNASEWSTESTGTNEPCSLRGAMFTDEGFVASRRHTQPLLRIMPHYSFRPLLYL